ncbi:TetR/AcrR family transcriptional regulator [Luteimonas sp. FCS-9]|uniref:TetR/AcrR family transcriptional regulator n=1 Tax=Luteimonas sp. FCS-9 TaxID=1547516 RepID=UPI00063EB5C8|nr:TetR/AcrR family transcriptional regulator [Luteimonas sp. FCS-9]KLI99044.1 TetR family transcriptional regulator [Luteimonas sp. FCS-9]
MATSSPHAHSPVRESILAHGQRIMAGKGFSAVGINEVLVASGVPKGSFYHYFASKEAFGEALLDSYFATYLGELDAILHTPGQDAAQRLMQYWRNWRDTQSSQDCQGRCLAVKLGAEVADLSDAMRQALQRGTAGIVDRLAGAIEAGIADGSLSVDGTPASTAQALYQLWLGASVMVKIVRNPRPFDVAIASTRRMLQLTP